MCGVEGSTCGGGQEPLPGELGRGRTAEEMVAQDGGWSSSVVGTVKDQQGMLFCLEGDMGATWATGDIQSGGGGIWDRMSGKRGISGLI